MKVGLGYVLLVEGDVELRLHLGGRAAGVAQEAYELGIGAIPLLPSATTHLTAWLAHVLGLPPMELASPGLPYIAYEHVSVIT